MTELIEQFDFSSSGSLAKMAEKMLDNDFKASHPDLVVWMEEQQLERRLQSQNNLSDGNQDNNGKTYPPRRASAGGLKASGSSGGLRTSPSKRSNGDLRVVIQEPPNNNSKRRKLDPSLTTRRLVYGTYLTALCLCDVDDDCQTRP